MTQFVDLVKTMSMLKHRSLSDMNIVGKFGGMVDHPIDDLPLTDNSVFIEVELLCGAFNRQIMENSALSEAHKYLIRSMKPVHFLIGTIYVLADKKYINSGIHSVSGRLSMVKGTKCSYYMSRWGKDENGVYNRLPASISEPNETIYTSEYMEWIKRSKELNKIVTAVIPIGVQVTGKEVSRPIFISKNLTVADIKNGIKYCDGNTEKIIESNKKPVLESPFDNLGISKVEGTPFIKPTSAEEYSGASYFSTNKKTNNNDIMRKTIEPKSEHYGKLQYAVSYAKDKIDGTLSSFSNSKSNIEEICIKMFAKYLNKFWKRKPRAGEGSTGSAIFKQSVYDLAKFMLKGEDDEKSTDTLKEVEATLDMYLDGTRMVEDWGKGKTDIRSLKRYIIDHRVDLMYAVFQNVADLKCDMLKLNAFCQRLDYTLLDIISINPYKLCLIDSTILLSDMDKIAMAMGVFRQNDDVELQRDIAVMHQFMTDANNTFINGSTVVTKRSLLQNFKGGYSISKFEHNSLLQFTVGNGMGVFLKKDTYTNIMNYFDAMKDEYVSIPCTGWLSDGNRFLLPSKFSNEEIYKGYIESGLGVKYTIGGIEYVSDYQIMSKENHIYNAMYKLSIGNTRVCNELDKFISEFEQLKNVEFGISDFKLEERQREAVKMVGKSSVFAIIGGAGCGKTTTAEAVVYALQKVYGFTDDEIRFVAPTGKAANRLKESVKRDTCTIHSLCRIGGTSNFISSGAVINTQDMENETKAIIVDESSMINLDVMYSFINWVKKGTIIIFLGDTGQLPAIGFGKIFADILKYIPCVTLNVSKRASAKSLITRNAERIIKESDGNVIEDLETGDDFKCIDMEQDMVPVAISELVKYHLGYSNNCSLAHIEKDKVGSITADDIQVVTPIRTKKYKWGSEHLNPLIQDIINPYNSRKRAVELFITQNESIEFRVGDRVIHTANITDKERYIYKKGKYKEIESTGIMNGDVGKIKNIYMPDEMKGLTESDTLLKMCNYNTIFVEVEYEDVGILNENGNSKFSIFYTASTSKDMFGRPSQINGRYTVTGGTLKLIDLAYALTVHKMQGSQAKLIIIPYFNVARHGFLSRNMLYTAVTRASNGCYLLGDVTGSGSALSRSRRLEVVSKRHSVVESIV